MARVAAYVPLDVRCPACQSVPGTPCRSVVLAGRPSLRRPHAERVTAARTSEQGRRRARQPATVTDAWTCPDCGRSYWAPAEWEPEVWPVLRRLLQQMHGSRHRREQHPDPQEWLVDQLQPPAEDGQP